MRPILYVLITIMDLYRWLLIAAAIFSWLLAFNVVNTRNQFVSAVAEFLYRITEPVLAPIRRLLPNFGGLDISPVITHRFPYNEFEKGIELMNSGNCGKIVLHWSDK